jgi:hypothetical protein
MTDDGHLPPRVLLDTTGVSTSVAPHTELSWSQLERVAVVNVVADNGYSECFWVLSGGGKRVVAPVEIVMGAEDLNARLSSLPGFDEGALQRARRAEAEGAPGEWVCWQKASA